MSPTKIQLRQQSNYLDVCNRLIPTEWMVAVYDNFNQKHKHFINCETDNALIFIKDLSQIDSNFLPTKYKHKKFTRKNLIKIFHSTPGAGAEWTEQFFSTLSNLSSLYCCSLFVHCQRHTSSRHNFTYIILSYIIEVLDGDEVTKQRTNETKMMCHFNKIT